jgi:hypothetical protein
MLAVCSHSCVLCEFVTASSQPQSKVLMFVNHWTSWNLKVISRAFDVAVIAAIQTVNGVVVLFCSAFGHALSDKLVPSMDTRVGLSSLRCHRILYVTFGCLGLSDGVLANRSRRQPPLVSI